MTRSIDYGQPPSLNTAKRRLTKAFHALKDQDQEAAMLPLRAPLARAMKTLDKSLFSKTFNISAATIKDNKTISKYRKLMEKNNELLALERLSPIAADPRPEAAQKGGKCLLLKPSVKPEDASTYGAVLSEGVKADELCVIPYELKLEYDYWSYLDVISSIIPEDLHDEIPTGYNSVGQVVHLNLRERYLPYKSVIAQVIAEKNSGVRTVINKVDNVGAESQFRTFAYEVLRGPDDLNVEVHENGCVFAFDYAKVYWNSKLETEHTRLINMFQPGEVVADVMAGIGPFAVPAGKKGVFVWANDFNPESYKYMELAVKKNKVGEFVRPFNQDGREFIHFAASSVIEASRAGAVATVATKQSRSDRQAGKPMPPARTVPVPPVVNHFVMNLPASATTFLHHFRGIYAGHEAVFANDAQQMPIVHVHCFAVKGDEPAAYADIVERIREEIGVTLAVGDGTVEGQVQIHDVRDVAPKKSMFCASFRLPKSVAFEKV
ncbi:tRNA (guanine(37)-N1)-methyltransferase [Ceratocystis fimbriata CBS 114723]|uniref:tRNA (guanine(37)-N1)-methyltransferase n=1 Tax=Ceratocystis fimbriata CBS 114723 TaxID=1035309 RepID=A0A2C5WNP5_9PEZI|nr:tRNA (guanine(37)-N1)-methyltransferase [Ceratocystis fimbriata CBS 114723]